MEQQEDPVCKMVSDGKVVSPPSAEVVSAENKPSESDIVKAPMTEQEGKELRKQFLDDFQVNMDDFLFVNADKDKVLQRIDRLKKNY